MEFLRRVIRQIQSQLGVLTTSQRLVVVLCVVIMCGAAFWMVKYAGQRELVPLLPQSFTEEERERIRNQFDDWQQRHEIVGDQILVPTEDRRRLIGKLGYAQLLPSDTSLGWSYLLTESGSIWTSESQTEKKWIIGLQTELARAIEEFPEVESANVFINKATKRRVSNIQPMASASVMVKLSGGAVGTARLGTAIADFVSGANNNMKRENVSVIANGQKLKVIAQGETAPSDYLELKSKWERHYRDKIISMLETASALVQVDVTPQLDETEQITVKVLDEASGGWLPTIQKSSSEQTSSNLSNNSEVGIRSNTGSTAGNRGGGQSETQEQSESKNQPFPGSQTVKTRKPPGDISKIMAVVSYPMSYFRALAKQQSADKTAEPTDEAVQALIDQEMPELREKVLGVIGKENVPENEAQVVVGTYWDEGSVLASGMGSVGEGDLAGRGGVGSMGELVRGFGKEIAVLALAVMSLIMVLMMVRKASGPIELEEDEAEALMKPGKKPLDAMSPEESNFAEAEDAGGLLTGVELDEQTVQSQQMLEQIRDMVKESPEKVANLVSKWIVQKE